MTYQLYVLKNFITILKLTDSADKISQTISRIPRVTKIQLIRSSQPMLKNR